MAVKSRAGSSVLKFLHFVVRFLGLNGLIAAAIGLLLLFALNQDEIGLILIIAGGSAAALALTVEIPAFASTMASHRGAAGLNVFIQIGLAATLVVGANVYSFDHYKRFDLTAKKIFTLHHSVREKLAEMRGDTEIVVYVQHVSFGQRVDLRQDDYDQAAERVITEKVVDLVEQFKEIGPRFRVHVLDTQKKSFKDHLERVKTILKDSAGPEVAADMILQITKSPEDSIFFFSPDTKNLQRLSFNDIYHLDKKASEEAKNLVLLDRGVQNFADKVLRIEEKKPRIGFAVVHEVLGQDGREDIGMPGLKDALPARGFEGRDIVLWKRLQQEAAALEHDESKFELLETRKYNYERIIKVLEEDLKTAGVEKKEWETSSIEELNKRYVIVLTNRGPQQWTRETFDAYRKETGRTPLQEKITEEFKAEEIKDWIRIIEAREIELEIKKERLQKTLQEKSKLRVENLAEQRRITDVHAKFNRLLDDIDMLVVPRATFFNLLRRDRIPNRVYPMAEDHLASIKDFMKKGKPVLFLLGPSNDEGDDDEPRADSLERMLGAFDVQLPVQAVLYTSEGEAMEETRERMGPPGGASVEIPPTLFEWKKSMGGRHGGTPEGSVTMPIGASMGVTVRALGTKSREDMRIRHPRPVYVVRTSWSPQTVAAATGAMALGWPAGTSQGLAEFFGNVNKKLDDKTVILVTDPDSWNEDRPIPNDRYSPRFKSPKQSDADKGTVLERRRGPFPIGVALEADVPLDWYPTDGLQKPQKVRLAVIGHGGLFIGEKLSPLREKLFVDVSNWLLGRETLLARETETRWEYPRVTMKPEIKTLWEWGARLGLPLVFVCLGMNVWLVRRMR